jgi:hypothetical protein
MIAAGLQLVLQSWLVEQDTLPKEHVRGPSFAIHLLPWCNLLDVNKTTKEITYVLYRDGQSVRVAH